MVLTTVHVQIEAWQREAVRLKKINMSDILRSAINVKLNIDANTIEKLEEELSQKEKVLSLERKALEEKKKHISSDAMARETRLKAFEWLKNNPKFLSAYKKGTVSLKGWQYIIKNLQAKNKTAAEKTIQEYLDFETKDRGV